MEINEFVAKIADQYDESEDVNFTAETHFREIEEYSSLTALTIIAMVGEDYKKTLSGSEIRGCTTIKDLFELVKSK